MNDDRKTWEELICDSERNKKFKSRTCSIYNNQRRRRPEEPVELCPCGRMIHRHSLVGESLESKEANNGNMGRSKWKPPPKFLDSDNHSAQVPITVYGTLQPSNCKFLRLDNRFPSKDLYPLILANCGMQRPALILSVYGGAKYFTMTERLEKEFIRGVIEAATVCSKL